MFLDSESNNDLYVHIEENRTKLVLKKNGMMRKKELIGINVLFSPLNIRITPRPGSNSKLEEQYHF